MTNTEKKNELEAVVAGFYYLANQLAKIEFEKEGLDEIINDAIESIKEICTDLAPIFGFFDIEEIEIRVNNE